MEAGGNGMSVRPSRIGGKGASAGTPPIPGARHARCRLSLETGWEDSDVHAKFTELSAKLAAIMCPVFLPLYGI